MGSIDSLRDRQPRPDQSIERASFLFFDIETTGLRPERGARITEVAFFDRNQECFLWHQSKSNISDKNLAAEIPEILDLLTKGVVVGHNLGFDFRFIAYETDRLGFRGPEVLFVDTLGLAKKVCEKITDFKLESLLEIFNISAGGPLHTALIDAQATRALFWKLINLGGIETLAQAGMQRVSWTTF